MPSGHDQSSAPAARGRSQYVIDRAWLWLVDGLAAVGTGLICVLMIIICADIVARNALGSSLPLVSELGALLLVMIVSLQLATTVRADRLARTEIFFLSFNRRYPRAGACLSAAFNLVGAAVIGGIAWSTIHILEKDWSAGEYIGVTGVATLQTWPFRALILLGMSVAAIEFLVQALSDLRRAVRAGRI
jgi:TRAP-type mannitol/chloroaromatic compound transport system permease small subunit